MSDKTQPVKRVSRFWLYAPFVLIMLLLAAYTAYWHYMRGELETGIDGWIAEQRAAGIEINFSSKRLDGFPYRFALTVEDPVFADPAQNTRWSGETLQLVMQPWNWNHVIGRSSGMNKIATPDGVFDVLLGDKSVASLSWDAESVRRFSVVFDTADIALGDNPLGDIEGFELHMRPASDDPESLQIAAQWQAIHFDQPLVETAAVFGNDVQASQMQVELTDAYAAMKASMSPGAWGDAGGRVKLARLELNWGPARIGMKGDFSLNDCAVPDDGDLQIRLDDVPTLRSALQDARMLNLPTDAALSFLEDASEDGGFAPFSFRDGGIYMGLIPLGDLPQDC